MPRTFNGSVHRRVEPVGAAASDTYVMPFDPSHFSVGIPAGAASARVRSILANANRYALTTWWKGVKNYEVQTDTYLDLGLAADSAGWSLEVEDGVRPAASEAFALAVALATGGYDTAATGVIETIARRTALRLTRSLAYRHLVNTAGGWGDGWQSALWAALAGTAGWLLWHDLSTADREYVRKMVEFEANRFIGWQVPYWKDRSGSLVRDCGDTAADESSWNARLLFLAPAMMPKHSRRSGWIYKANELSIGAFARPLDVNSDIEMRGRPLGDWLEGSNIDDDGAVVNHNFYHPDYMATISEMISGGLVPALAGDVVPINSLHGTSLEYAALVNKRWWPAPALPCSDSPAFVAPGFANQTGTIYGDGSSIYYPEGNDWGSTRRANFADLDVMVGAFGLDDLVARKAQWWENLHAQAVLDMQVRELRDGSPSDGSTYRSPSEDTYPGREEWVAARGAEMWLTKWLDAQGALITTNSPQQIVVDDGDRWVTIVGEWTIGSPVGQGPEVFGPSVRYKPAGSGSAYIRFAPRMTQTRSYDIYAWWFAAPAHATNTPFEVRHAAGVTVITRNQQLDGGAWMLLGTFTMSPGSHVQVSDNADGHVVADGILLDPQ